MKLPFFNLMKPNRRASTRTEGDPSGTQGNKARGRAYPGSTSDLDSYQRNPLLSGTNKYRSLYAMKRGVPVVSALWGVLEGLAQQAVFTVDAPEERAEAVFGPLLDSWAVAMGRMSEAYMVGTAIVEWTAKMTGGMYSLAGLTRIPPGSVYEFILDDAGRIDAFRQQGAGTLITIPRWKTLHVTEGNGIEGEGVLTTVGEDCLLTLNHRKLLNAGNTSNLRNMPDFMVPAAALEDDNDPAVKTAETVLRDKKEGNRVIWPSDVQTVDDGAGGERPVVAKMYDIDRPAPVPIADNDQFMELQKRIAIALGVQSLLLGQDGAGSLALARVESQVLHTRFKGTLTVIAKEVQRMLAFFWAANGWGDGPVVTVDNSGWRDPMDLADILMKLKDVPTEKYGDAVNDILASSGMPEMDDSGTSVIEQDGDQQEET